MSVAYNPGRRRMAHDTLLPDLSVVIPIRNEAPNLRELHRELDETLQAWGRPYELVIIDDGSTDESFDILRELQAARSPPAGDPVPPQLRPDGGVLGGIRPRPRPDHRDVGRRPAERPARHPRPRGRSRARPRHRLRMAQEPQGHVADAPPPVEAGQHADLEGHRRGAARLRMFPQGVSGGGRQAAAPVRRDAPLHPGDRQRHGRDDRRTGRQPPRAPVRPFEIWALADDPGRAGPADRQVHAALRDPPAADLRLDRPGDGGLGVLVTGWLVAIRLFTTQAIGDRPLLLFGILLVFTGLQFLTIGLLAELQIRTYHESQDKPTYAIRETLGE